MPNRLTPIARKPRQNQTEAEKRLWSRLRARQLQGIKFVRQYPVGPYVADFASRSLRLVTNSMAASTLTIPPMQGAHPSWRSRRRGTGAKSGRGAAARGAAVPVDGHGALRERAGAGMLHQHAGCRTAFSRRAAAHRARGAGGRANACRRGMVVALS